MGMLETDAAYLRNMCIERGWNSANDVRWPIDRLQSLVDKGHKQRVDSWFRNFYALPDIRPSLDMPRLVNHFSVGADPEFMFVNNAGEMINANTFRLHSGACAGADGNDRIVELRPAPSRRVLDIVASILVELRWLAYTRPKTLSYTWLAFPFEQREAMGGHIHFGRKHNATEEVLRQELYALNAVLDMFLEGGIFNPLAQHRRATQSPYGDKDRDALRPQPFGYEYRVFPTWLDSPWLAFLTLTIAKLVVHHKPSNWNSNVPPAVRIKNLLAAYKGLDDDALLAYKALQMFGLPKQNYADMRTAWGITRPYHNITIPAYDPKMLRPSRQEIEEVQKHLFDGTPLTMTCPSFFGEAATIPDGYVDALTQNWNYHRYYGLPELLSELVVAVGEPFYVAGTEDDDSFRVTAPYNTLEVAQALHKYLPNASLGRSGDITLVIPREYRTAQHIRETRVFLTSGVFPIWHIKDVRPDSYAKWKAARVKTSARHKVQAKSVVIDR